NLASGTAWTGRHGPDGIPPVAPARVRLRLADGVPAGQGTQRGATAVGVRGRRLRRARRGDRVDVLGQPQPVDRPPAPLWVELGRPTRGPRARRPAALRDADSGSR